MIYWQLFVSFLKIGVFGFGGGLAVLSLIQHEVESHGWLTQSEFVDIVAVSQVTPGPIGINCATYVGYTTTGSVWGSTVATFAIVLPSLVTMLGLCKVYFALNTRFQRSPYFQNTMRMLRFAVLGLIAAAALCLMTPESFIDARSWVIFFVVCAFTILPSLLPKQPASPQGKGWKVTCKVVEILSHPIVLILLAGGAGYLIY